MELYTVGHFDWLAPCFSIKAGSPDSYVVSFFFGSTKPCRNNGAVGAFDDGRSVATWKRSCFVDKLFRDFFD